MDLRCGSNDRVPVLQMQTPVFKSQSNQKKKNSFTLTHQQLVKKELQRERIVPRLYI
jgi:hypothetical protein